MVLRPCLHVPSCCQWLAPVDAQLFRLMAIESGPDEYSISFDRQARRERHVTVGACLLLLNAFNFHARTIGERASPNLRRCSKVRVGFHCVVLMDQLTQ